MKILFLLLLALDQLIKRLFLFHQHFNYQNLVLVKNTGIAFGLFQNSTFFIILLNLIIIMLIIFFRKTLFYDSTLRKLAFIFILAGGFGNLIDRCLLGFVIDFIAILNFPVFNIADVYINIGIFLLLISYLRNAKKGI